MKKQRNKWECFPTALAIAIDCDIDSIINLIGHDGSEIVGDVGMYVRGFHIQEIVKAALTLGYIPVRIEYAPATLYGTYVHRLPDNAAYIRDLMYTQNGVLETQHMSGIGHAFAIRNGKIINPTTGLVATNLYDFTHIAFTALFDFKTIPKNIRNQIKC